MSQVWLPLVFSCAVVGCGGGGKIAAVSGRVTLAGQPLAGAVVTFQPMQDPDEPAQATSGSVGHTDSDGRFELRQIATDRAGAAVGKHRVSISTASADPTTDVQLPTGERVPPEWRDGSQVFTVPAEGTSQADFAIP
jgi:hypothetical protein